MTYQLKGIADARSYIAIKLHEILPQKDGRQFYQDLGQPYIFTYPWGAYPDRGFKIFDFFFSFLEVGGGARGFSLPGRWQKLSPLYCFFQFESCVIYCFHMQFVFDFVLDVLFVVYLPRVYLSDAKVNIYLFFFVSYLLFGN